MTAMTIKSHLLISLLLSINLLAEERSAESLNKDVHLNLRPNELHQLFGTDDPNEVPAYDVVYPSLVDQNARRSVRARRSLHDTIPMFMHFKAFDTDFHVNVTRNKDIGPDVQLIEHHNEQGTTRLKGKSGTHSIGNIVSDEDSIVALDHSIGWHGLIMSKRDIFSIAPIPRSVTNVPDSSDSLGAHIIFKNSALLKSQASKRSGRQTCGVKDEGRSIKKVSSRTRRSLVSRPEKTMELMIVGDKTMVAFYGKDFLPSYLLTIGNMVAGLFRDRSLEYPITVVVTRIIVLETDVFANASSMGSLLGKFREWGRINNPADDSSPLHADNAVLFTRNGCTGDCGVQGLAYLGMCSHSISYSTVNDLGTISSFVTAHEIGHNLGLGHDGSARCPDGVNVMASGGTYGAGSFEWSNCSSEYLKTRFQSSASFCFNDKPSTNNYPVNSSFDLYGQVYNADKQCQFIHGPEFVQCRFRAHYCSALWCMKKNTMSCNSRLFPPAHGTRCGNHMWCIHAECVKDGITPAPPIDGGWSAFSNYTNCNRPCGGGVQWRARTCTNPSPQHGGKNCVGETKSFWKTCNMQQCSAGTESFRTEQCKAYGADKKYYIPGDNPCRLICGNAASGWYVYGHVKDGTFASNNGPDICIQGVPRKVGCDLALESGAIPDRCGICGGDGSTCVPVTSTNHNAYSGWGQHEVGVIPAGAFQIKINELQATKGFIGIKVGTSTALAYSLPSYSKRLKVAGADLVYTMNALNYPDQVTIKGIINTQIRIIFFNCYYASSKGIEWIYYMPSDGNTSAVEYAVPDKWGSCSKSCAGGKQTRELKCRRVDDKTAISLSFCSSLVKPKTEQACNTQACPPQWHLTQWSACSKSCATGQKTRNLECSKLRADQKYYQVNNESLCTATKPTDSLIANCSIVICPSKWIPGSWNQCNTTCDLGIKTRAMHCERTDKDGRKSIVRDLECSYLPKPIEEEECNLDNPCPEWKIEYSTCSKSCDGGLQSPYLECRVPGSNVKLNDDKCLADKKPDLSKIASKACNTHLCVGYEWKSVEGTCSVSCGNGTISINVFCQRIMDNATVSENNCLNLIKPPTSKHCNAGICPEIYKWELVKGSCSATCGNGTIKTTAVCFRQRDAKMVDDIFCEASIRPATGSPVACSLGQCPEVYIWNVTYGACSVSCSVGIKQPMTKCVKQSDVSYAVDDSLCLATRPQPGPISCDMGACPATYSWRQLWTKCNVTCGTGYKTSHYKCFMDNTNTEMDSKYCTASKPASTTAVCSIICNYEWAPTFGDCVTSCGSGYKMMELSCQYISNKTLAESSECIAERSKVPAHQKCPTLPACPQNSTTSSSRSFYKVGCFHDNLSYRRIPFYVKNLRNQITDWYDLSPIVTTCANTVVLPETKTKFGAELPFFAIQYYGECWAGNSSTQNKYYLSGPSTNCYLGTGGEYTNYVYHYRSTKEITMLDPILSVGCFNDDGGWPKPLPVLVDNFEDIIKTESIATIVKKCAIAAARRHFTHFGIEANGKCWSGPNAWSTYNEDGQSTVCKNGVGGPSSFFVYQFLN